MIESCFDSTEELEELEDSTRVDEVSVMLIVDGWEEANVSGWFIHFC